jgi:hypothetical protein
MSAASPAAPSSLLAPAFRRLWQQVRDVVQRWWLHTPLTALAIYCLISVQLQENYPFSHFPMYSNPSPERPYYIIADGSGKPLPIAALTGVTCPKVGKIYRTECQDVADKLKLNKDKLPQEHRQAIGEKMFAYFRREAAGRKQAMPEKLQLVRVEISYQNGKIVETPEIIAEERGRLEGPL